MYPYDVLLVVALWYPKVSCGLVLNQLLPVESKGDSRPHREVYKREQMTRWWLDCSKVNGDGLIVKKYVVSNWRGIRGSRFLSIPESTGDSKLVPEACQATMAKCKCAVSLRIKYPLNQMWVSQMERGPPGRLRLWLRRSNGYSGSIFGLWVEVVLLDKNTFPSCREKPNAAVSFSPQPESFKDFRTDIFWSVNCLAWPFLTTWIDDIY